MSSIKKSNQLGKAIDKQEDIHPFAIPFLWLGKKKVIDNFIWFPFSGLIFMILIGFLYPQKHPAPWDVVPGSWALIGFVSYSLIVLCAKPLTFLLARPESYYGEGGLLDPEFSVENVEDGHD
ncbi:MAG: hypothetical protein P8H55_03845 [Hellea sp.]|nr:hypothetical protein [Hellea sp.]MDG1666290.1 hypothetical protein [Hellea sp.]